MVRCRFSCAEVRGRVLDFPSGDLTRTGRVAVLMARATVGGRRRLVNIDLGVPEHYRTATIRPIHLPAAYLRDLISCVEEASDIEIRYHLRY